MRTTVFNCLLTLALFATGCAFNREAVITEPVGPPPRASHVPSSDGSLVVYSGFEVNDVTGFAYENVQPHTPYDIYASDGKLVKHVRNYAGGLLDAPETVALSAGNYKVTARANGYARVVLPVLVIAGKTTAVHLDSSGFNLSKQNPTGNLVKLPDGQIIGWLADESSNPNRNP
jgi:hypothetical protein